MSLIEFEPINHIFELSLNMEHPKVSMIIFMLLSVSVYLGYKFDQSEHIKINKLLINNIEFEGIIKSYKISRNHSFAIIVLDRVKSNISNFDADLKDKFFPYAIKDGKAEIYTVFSPHEGKKIGDTLRVLSNQRLLIFTQKDGNKDTTSIQMINEQLDKSYIRENTLFK